VQIRFPAKPENGQNQAGIVQEKEGPPGSIFHPHYPMDSINSNQSEENHRDLTGLDALDKIRELVKKAEICFFCTASPVEGSCGVRPMAVQEMDGEGNLWFLSPDDSHKNLEIARDPSVRLYFQGSGHSDFLLLNGTASISRDDAKIRELWEPVIRTWFTEGVEDPRITVIKVTPRDGYYWDTKHGNTIAGIKMLIGAAIGKTMDDSIEGTLRV
jgi:general stress protein 26